MDSKIADKTSNKHLISPEWKKLICLGDESLSNFSLECILEDLRIAEPNKTCVQHSAEHGSWLQTLGLQDDVGIRNDEVLQSGSARSKPDVEDAGVNIHGCSFDQSSCSRNRNEGAAIKSSLRLRLQVRQEDGSYPKQMDLEEQQSSGRGRDREQRRGTNDVDLEGTEGSPGIGSTDSGEVNVFMPRTNSRYSLRPRPERRRRHQSDDLQKVVKRKSSSGRTQKRIEIEETDKKEVEEDNGQESGCARADFVYRRDERTYELPEAPGPLQHTRGVKFLTRASESKKRSHRRETQLFVSRSGIHGNGLFTKGEIPAGGVILEFVGEKIREVISDLREKRYEEKGEQSCYMFSAGTGMVIDSTRKGSVGRFINHCCSPNSVAKPAGGRIFVYAKRVIPEGEEITMDYGSGEGDNKRRCNCGAAGCRGVLAV